MSRFALLPVAAACLWIASPAAAQDHVPANAPPVIVTVGRSTVRVAPDRAFVSVATEATAPAPAAAQQQIAQTMTAVRAALRAARIPDEAVKTQAYGLNEEIEFRDGKRVVRGYRARNSIEVRVDEIPRVGEVIDAAVKAGANAVNDIRFDLKDRDGAEREALKRAVVDARARADALAAGAGVTITGIVRVDEQGRNRARCPGRCR